MSPINNDSIKVLFATSEAVPFAKTGGLADVAGALPPHLAAAGIDIRLVMPRYAAIDAEKYYLVPILQDIVVELGQKNYLVSVSRTLLPGTQIPVYFIDCPPLFNRDGLYLDSTGKDFADNAIRYAVFCQAIIWLCKALDWIPDILHCNDWQTALLPVYLRTHKDMKSDPALTSIETVFTIHNMGYQGMFPPEMALACGIGNDLFHPAALEFHGKLNLMKGGLLMADQITTVSPTYAREIQTVEFGHGLDGVLRNRKDCLNGILNGIDTQEWNPATDTNLASNYDPTNLSNKAQCKAALQQKLNLSEEPNVPLVTMISRLDAQKGLDILLSALPHLLEWRQFQLVILGTGAAEYHNTLTALQERFPHRVRAILKFDGTLAHQIEAGGDLFLMPSRYEPCGLNQMYSMRYGTIPVARATGGLADTITHVSDRESIRAGTATGYLFTEYTATALAHAVESALSLYSERDLWSQLQRNAMAQDFGWQRAAADYLKIYQSLSHKDS